MLQAGLVLNLAGLGYFAGNICNIANIGGIGNTGHIVYLRKVPEGFFEKIFWKFSREFISWKVF